MRRLLISLSAVAVLAGGCHGSTAPTNGAAEGPLVLPPIPNNGGRTIPDMKVVPIFYAGDPVQAQMEAFLHDFNPGNMPDFFAAVSELGGALGSIEIEPSVVLKDLPPGELDNQTDLEGGANPIRPYLRGLAMAGTLPAYKPGMIYVLFPPLSTQTTLHAFQGCRDYVGYHDHDPRFPSGAGDVDAPFSVILRCVPPSGYTTVSEMTQTVSHELAEAASDPDLDGWTLDLFDVVDEGEDGDLCAWEPATKTVGANTWTYQRMWSNQADVGGKDPCVPAPGPDYANVVPIPAAVEVTAGSTAHFDLHVISPDGSLVPKMPKQAGDGVYVYAALNYGGTVLVPQGWVGCDPSFGKECHWAGDVIPYDVQIPAGLAPGHYWLNVFAYYGPGLSEVSQAFAGVDVLPR